MMHARRGPRPSEERSAAEGLYQNHFSRPRPAIKESRSPFPDDLEALLDLWHDIADRFLCAAWWRLVDGAGLDDCEGYRLTHAHFATDDQWAIARALTAACQCGVKPTVCAIDELAVAAGASCSAAELGQLHCLEATSAGLHAYAAVLLECARRRAVIAELDQARDRLLNPTIPAAQTVRELKAALENDMAKGLPEPPGFRLASARWRPIPWRPATRSANPRRRQHGRRAV